MSKKPLTRRQFIKGTGAAIIALPWLPSLQPAHAQAAGAPLRLAILFWPYGTVEDSLYPGGSGTNFTMPGPWNSLTPYKSDLTILRRIHNYHGQANNGDGAGDHARAQGTYLTCTRINKSETDIRNGVSMDQLVANQVGANTPVKLLNVAGPGANGGDSGYSAEYTKLSWFNANTPASLIYEPYQVFNQLFSGVSTPQQDPQRDLAALKLQFRKSILDDAVATTQRLMGKAGQTDRTKLDQYLTSVREVEVKIENLIKQEEEMNPPAPQCNPGTAPSRNLNFDQRTQIMLDLIALGFQCDTNRVSVFRMGTSSFDFYGVSGGHHSISHWRDDPNNSPNKLRKINEYYAVRFAGFLQKLKETQDIDDSPLLNNTIVTFGSGMHDGNAHDDTEIPLIVAGRAGGKFTPGKVINTGQNIRMANVWLTIMQTMGVNINSFGSGNGASNGTVAL